MVPSIVAAAEVVADLKMQFEQLKMNASCGMGLSFQVFTHSKHSKWNLRLQPPKQLKI